jgi:hypothetical protein
VKDAARLAVEDGDRPADGRTARTGDADEGVRAGRTDDECRPGFVARVDPEVLQLLAGRGIEDVRVRVRVAGTEVRRADDEPRADGAERPAEAAAVLGDREPANRPVEGRGAGVRGRRRRDEEKSRDECDAEAPQLVAMERADTIVAMPDRRRGDQCFSLATASFISGTALKRSATRP